MKTHGIDLSLAEMVQGLVVRRVVSFSDIREVLKLRHRGYKCFEKLSDTLDDLDIADNSVILVAEHERDGIIGTLRLSNGIGEVELDKFIRIAEIEKLCNRSFIEATRFTIKPHTHFLAAKMLLCKAHWLFTLKYNSSYLLMSSKPELAPFYEYMHFSDIGEKGEYKHTTLKMAYHKTYILDALAELSNYKEVGHIYYDFMIDKTHKIFLD